MFNMLALAHGFKNKVYSCVKQAFWHVHIFTFHVYSVHFVTLIQNRQ